MKGTALRRITMIGVLALAATACSSIGERVTEGVLERAVGGDADVDIDDDGEGSITVESSEGTSRFGDVDSLPDSFPDDVPLPSADYQITQTLEDSSGGGGTSVHATLAVQAAADDLAEELEAGFAANGWENETTNRSSGDGYTQIVLGYIKGDTRVLVMIMSDGDDGTVVSYTAGSDA
jgi:hypothetical protein